MLRCKNLSVRAGGADGALILSDVNAEFCPRALNAVIGPSGCGKTTLVKAMLRLTDGEGKSFFEGREIHDPEELAGRVGFAQQFTNAFPQLSVEETFRAALDLSVRDARERERRMESVLAVTGLAEHRDKRVGTLSGGQLRRLGLGVELTLDPACLVCDEVTSGLDPNSESQILALLRRLVQERGKAFVCIIHNLAKVEVFDWVTVVFQGAVVFQGSPALLLEYFDVPDALHIYDVLNAQPVAFWRERWDGFLANNPGHFFWHEPTADESSSAPPATHAQARPVGVPRQFMTLLRRRSLLFLRDTGYFALTLAITFGFPLIVVIFALGGLPEVPRVPLERVQASLEAFTQAFEVQKVRVNAGALASGLVMFQVILLTLMGANNGGREIAGERSLYEKERLTGLRPMAYVLSKMAFVALVACFQGAWMACFVKLVCGFPGPWGLQLGTMMAVCVSMSLVCLGFSAIMQSAEKASLLSIYLVGFQIPLSGVVLALPDALTWVCRPFINAYWGWSGFMSSMHAEHIYDAYSETNLRMFIASPGTSNAVLALQALTGIALIIAGCVRRRAL
ncbi:MAG: ATP-binding cassette domain-containing protein [Puniceicoccales bacterium]|jgi:ABC-type multidrug transport system ATPase subunit|nr:ATP-binding cassette domain-containing protein [Puniceicoccales bacterium]